MSLSKDTQPQSAEDNADSTATVGDAIPRPSRLASDQLDVTCVTRRPRAIVVVLGSIGCDADHISSICKLYHEKNCSTIAATAPALVLATNDTTTLGELAITVCREAARLVRMAEMSEMGYGLAKVVLHVMGNGGAQVVEELERRLREVISSEDMDQFKNNVSESSCPLPVRALSVRKSAGSSSRSLLSTVMLSDSEEEDERRQSEPESGRDKPVGGRMLTHKPTQRTSSSLSLSSRFSFGRSTTGAEETSSSRSVVAPRRRRRRRKKRAPTVERIDMERTGLPSSLTLPRYNSDDRAYLRDMELFAARLGQGCILWDAAPNYPTLDADWEAAQSGISSTFPRMLVQSAIMSTHGVHGLCRLSWIGNRYPLTDCGELALGGRSEQFWQNMIKLSLAREHVFIYNPSDPVCDVRKLEDLMEEQQTNGIHVKRLELTSGTIVHLDTTRYKKEEYLSFVEDVVDGLAARKLGEGDEEWWSSDDEDSGAIMAEP